jgi:hypothetical protein
MVQLIKGQDWFRWHDSGDIQSMKHLENIFEVCKRTSGTKHWMPTREAQFLKQLDPATIPPNLIIRMSSHMIDQGPVKFWPWTSTVTSKQGRTCPAPARLQALKLQATSIPTSAQGFKLQARVNKLQDLMTRVQAHKPTVRGASNKNKSILSVFNMEGYLVG